MVSFFGFKIGGEKKKKPANEVASSPIQSRRRPDQDRLAEGQFLNGDDEENAHVGFNDIPGCHPDSLHAYNIAAPQTRGSPYGSETRNFGAMSMSEISQPNNSSLKQYASQPNLGSSRFNASTSDLVPPVPVRNPTRPSTPVKQEPTWMNPLEMHSTRGPLISALSAPKSPLAQFELKLDIPNNRAHLYNDEEQSPQAPMPLRIKRPGPGAQLTEPPEMMQSPQKPPSPPQSIKDIEGHSPVTGRPIFQRDDLFRPSSRGSYRTVPTTLREVKNAWNMPNYGPTSMPSPASTPRGSEEKPTNNLTNLWGEPVIHTVGARRDTLASVTHQRMSLEIKLEELEAAFVDEPAQWSKPSSSGPQMRPLVRPPPLNLDPRPRTPDRAGTYPPAPFMKDHRPRTPTGEGSRRPTREPLRTGPPPGAVGAYGRPGKPNTRNVHRPAADEYVIQPRSQPSSQPQSRRVSLDSRPASPDSPLLPQTGPLASPRFPPIDSQLAPPPLKGGARSHLQIETFSLDDENDDQLAAPRLGNRNVPTPDSSQWPVPSPTESTFDTWQSYRGESPFVTRDESPFMRAESPLETPPRVLPQGVVSRSESPFGFRPFNFSRPMTPTLEQGPLRRDDHRTVRAPRYPPKRSETVPISPQFRDYESSPSPGGPPPPRANTVRGNAGRGLRSPAIVGDDFGVGFI
ncbi:hypothetical protein F4804DRAFT_332730 [Jackrogersella minutella]|nr:hypothetical protein F4804DRAFT_332730 [Jackrogersella minutella]